MRILIAYASVHGSTAEVARFMERVLEEQGIQATVASVDMIRDLDEYDVILLGSAIHKGMLLPEMNRFIRLFRTQLASKPIYLWVMCIRVLEPNGYTHVLEHYIPAELTEQFNIRGVRAFAGKLNYDDIEWLEHWTLDLRYDGARKPDELQGDYRDWEAIREWTNQVAFELARQE